MRYKSMSERELEEMASAKRKGKPQRKSKRRSNDSRSVTAGRNINMRLQAMLKTHPAVAEDVNEFAIRATEACFDCAQACVACADACLADESVAELRQCIAVNLDCAEVCSAAGVLGTRGSVSDRTIMDMMFDFCAEVCRRCGDECLRHAEHHEHCRICAEFCRSCAKACLATGLQIVLRDREPVR